MAKFYFKACLLFTFLVAILYLLILITFKDQTINFFSESADSNSLTNGSFVLIVCTVFLSWFDVANSGLLRGLGIQVWIVLNYLISIYTIALPLGYYLVFHYGEHASLEGNNLGYTVPGMGIKGFWIAQIIGFVVNLMMSFA